MSNAKMTVDRMRQKQGQITGTPPVPPPPTPPANDQPRRAAPKGKAGPRFPEFRLPHGAVFEAKYDAEAQRWAATLTVPDLPVYRTISGGIHQALIYLGRRWFDEHGCREKAGEQAAGADRPVKFDPGSEG